MKKIEKNHCKICWYYYKDDDLPWWEDGKSPTFSFCYCCWVEFWYQDSTLKWIKLYRQNWIDDWFKWFLKREKPNNWDSQEQMKNIPNEYQ